MERNCICFLRIMSCVIDNNDFWHFNERISNIDAKKCRKSNMAAPLVVKNEQILKRRNGNFAGNARVIEEDIIIYTYIWTRGAHVCLDIAIDPLQESKEGYIMNYICEDSICFVKHMAKLPILSALSVLKPRNSVLPDIVGSVNE